MHATHDPLGCFAFRLCDSSFCAWRISFCFSGFEAVLKKLLHKRQHKKKKLVQKRQHKKKNYYKSANAKTKKRKLGGLAILCDSSFSHGGFLV
jgi:predicted DNA repair protein MutK